MSPYWEEEEYISQQKVVQADFQTESCAFEIEALAIKNIFSVLSYTKMIQEWYLSLKKRKIKRTSSLQILTPQQGFLHDKKNA